VPSLKEPLFMTSIFLLQENENQETPVAEEAEKEKK